MTRPESTIRVDVDPGNPGEFFACCGLLELADRLWYGAEGWFEESRFHVAAAGRGEGGSLGDLLTAVRRSGLKQLDAGDDMTSRLGFDESFGRLTLAWWRDERSEHPGSELKTWAGQQKVVRIAKAMLVPASPPSRQPGPCSADRPFSSIRRSRGTPSNLSISMAAGPRRPRASTSGSRRMPIR
jgi:hypothetical protein